MENIKFSDLATEVDGVRFALVYGNSLGLTGTVVVKDNTLGYYPLVDDDGAVLSLTREEVDAWNENAGLGKMNVVTMTLNSMNMRKPQEN